MIVFLKENMSPRNRTFECYINFKNNFYKEVASMRKLSIEKISILVSTLTGGVILMFLLLKLIHGRCGDEA